MSLKILFFYLELISLAHSYQFNPLLYNPDVVINILLKALTASPLPDFNLCISLLDERPVNSQLDEPDPLPATLPILKGLHNLLLRCRFPAFWTAYQSADLELLRDNYTVEVVGFEDAVRAVAIRAVRTTFTRISSERLGSYLNLSGSSSLILSYQPNLIQKTGPDLTAYIQKLGWAVDPSTSVVSIPPNPDNQIEATVVQEAIKLPQLTKIIAHSVSKA